MDLTAFLLRVAARRPHVLVVAVPGATEVRLAVEAALARRGWPVATGPADADVLAVAGAPGPELAAVVDAVWDQVPAPRARIEVPASADVDRRLAAAATLLADADYQRARPQHQDPRSLHAPVLDLGDHGHAEHGAPADHPEHRGEADHGSHGQHAADGGDAGHAQHDHAGHEGEAAGDHAGHGGDHHDHHGHGGTVAGLPMAEPGPDRDGLTLDRLHVPLGPVLPDWPTGLVVRVTLQGDVIQEASAEVLDAGHAEPFEWPSAAARELDGLARFLGVAGWPSVAGRARRLRDALLAGEQVSAEVMSLVRRIRRSRTMRWLIRGIPAGGTDVAALLAARLEAIEAAVVGSPPEPQRGGVAQAGQSHHAATQLADLLVGAELAAARMVVAAVDPDADRVEAGHG